MSRRGFLQSGEHDPHLYRLAGVTRLSVAGVERAIRDAQLVEVGHRVKVCQVEAWPFRDKRFLVTSRAWLQDKTNPMLRLWLSGAGVGVEQFVSSVTKRVVWPDKGDIMGIPWRKLGGVLKGLVPFVPLVGGPAGAILKAVSSAIQIIEDIVIDQPSATKRQRAIDLTGTLLTIAEDATNRNLMDNQTLTTAVGAVIDAEVALRNAHAALAAVVTDLRGEQPHP